MASISWRMSRPGDTGDSNDGFPQLYRLRIGTGQLQQEKLQGTGGRYRVEISCHPKWGRTVFKT